MSNAFVQFSNVLFALWFLLFGNKVWQPSHLFHLWVTQEIKKMIYSGSLIVVLGGKQIYKETFCTVMCYVWIHSIKRSHESKSFAIDEGSGMNWKY